MNSIEMLQQVTVDPATAENPFTKSNSRRFINAARGDEALVAFLNHVFVEAAALSASDVHFRDGGSYATVRYRLSGKLEDRYYISKDRSQEIDHRIRARCQLNSTERVAPLDGKFWFDLDDRLLDVRVSIMPTKHGQTIVCRLLDQANAGRQLVDVEMAEHDRVLLMRCLKRTEGLILVTGPTGSGKTSTLYACVNYLNDEGVHICTAEDPIEYDLPGLSQTSVADPTRSYARIMRGILRQDPDIIMVGEIRDSETASVTLQAGNTGHVTLSSLHTNDAPSAVTRMKDLGVERFAFGSALLCIVSQRLEQKLCPHCAIQHVPTPDETSVLKARGQSLDQIFWRANHDGCEQCRPSPTPEIGATQIRQRVGGEKGKVPIIAMLEGTDALKRAIQYGGHADIDAAVKEQSQYRPLPLRALDLCVAKKLDFHRAMSITETST